MRGSWIHWAAAIGVFAGLAASSPSEDLAVPGVVAATPFERDDAGVPTMEIEMGIAPGSGIARLSDDDLAADLERLRAAGITWIRLDLPWSVIEPERGDFDWSTTDRLIEAALAHDLEVDALLAYTPWWANGDADSDKFAPLDPTEFARFAAAAAERYAPQGVHTWELWNEPNLSNFWAPSPDPVAYADLASAAAAAIRQADPEAFIISGGLAPAVDEAGNSVAPETFLSEMFAVLAPGTLDAVGIHPYSFPADPTDRDEQWNTYGRLPEIAVLVDGAAGAPLPLWLTEFGAPFDPDDPSRQADIVVEGVACAQPSPFTGPVFVYALRDAIEPADELPFGLIDADGTDRPSWTALAELLASPGSFDGDCW